MASSEDHICNPPILDIHLMLSWILIRPKCIAFGLFRMCVLSVLSLSKFVLPCPVVSEVPHESVAHRPVEMLPLICSRDQRKAAQLQVRAHAPCRSVLLHGSEVMLLLLLSERRWPRRTTLPWIKLVWRSCLIRYVNQNHGNNINRI